MSALRLFVSATFACLAVAGIQATAVAQARADNVAGTATADATDSRVTNKLLLDALIKRRAELAGIAGQPDARRAALDFLDQRIAEVRGRVGK